MPKPEYDRLRDAGHCRRPAWPSRMGAAPTGAAPLSRNAEGRRHMKFSIATVSLGGTLAGEAGRDRRRRLRGGRDLRGRRAGARGLAGRDRPDGARPGPRDRRLPAVPRLRGHARAAAQPRLRAGEAQVRADERARRAVASSSAPTSRRCQPRRHRPGGGRPARARRDRRRLRRRDRLRGAGLGPARLATTATPGRWCGAPTIRRLGIILDSFHVLSRGLPVDPIRAIPADRITFVQLADAPRMAMDLLQWSRHFRNFPGQGDLPVDAFMAAVEATGYDGWLSHEIFNDRFRMASPRRIAEDGERSLIWLEDRMRPGRDAAAGGARGGRVDRVRGLGGRRAGRSRRSSPGSGSGRPGGIARRR